MTANTIITFLILARWVYVEIMYREAVKAISSLSEWANRHGQR